MERLSGKVAVVTGAGRGLGKKIALTFAVHGSMVIIVNNDQDQGEQTVAEIKQIGGEALSISADVSKSEEVQCLFKQVQQNFGQIDILVNNAGITGRSIGDGPVADCLEEAWDQILNVNLKGTFLCCKYGLPLMFSQEKGSIINMSSVLGLVGCQDYFTSHAYQTTKAGINGLTRSIAAHYAKQGIRANALAPGLIDTPATSKVQQNEETMAFTRRMQPLKELGSPTDVAQAAVYLASDESSFVTGQVLAIDGGWTVQ